MNGDEKSATRDRRTGQFLPGHSGMGGRPRGNRNKLGEAFLLDLREVWDTHGRAALIACAEAEPAQFIRVMAGLLPRELDVEIDITMKQATSALEAYRVLRGLSQAELRALHAQESLDAVE